MPRVSLLLIWVVVNQFGCGMLLPTLVVWVMGTLPFEIRGRGTGLFMMSWWIGQFLSPQLATVIGKAVAGLPATLATLGGSCLAAAGIAALFWRGRRARAAQAS